MKINLTEPPHRICSICKDDGMCLNNEKHPNYNENNKDFFGTDYWDCTEYIEKRDGLAVGTHLRNWSKKLQNQPKITSSFSTWNKSINNSSK